MMDAASQKKRRKLNKAVEEFFGKDLSLRSANLKKTTVVTVSQNKETNSSSELENDIPFEYTSDSDEDFEDGFSTSEFDLDESDNQQDSELDADTEYLNNFTYQISKWSATSNCSREKLNELLAILKTEGGHSDLPKDIRTLIGTPREISSVLKCGGEYIYDGILKGIIESFSSNPILKESEILKLDVNIDGLPLCKSSKSHLSIKIIKIEILETQKEYEIFLVCSFLKPSSSTKIFKKKI